MHLLASTSERNLQEDEMKKVIVSLAVAIMLLGLSGVAMAYTIVNDTTGGDCTQIGIWDAATKTCTMTTDIYEPNFSWVPGFQWPEWISLDSGVTLDGNGHLVQNGNLYHPANHAVLSNVPWSRIVLTV